MIKLLTVNGNFLTVNVSFFLMEQGDIATFYQCDIAVYNEFMSKLPYHSSVPNTD